MKLDYIALAVPVFFVLIGVELTYAFYKKLKYFRFNDSISNLSQGIGSQLTGLFLKTALFFGYTHIFENWRLFTFSDKLWVWIVLFIGVDFCYYWFHRMSHQVNALWAAHIVHHQSEEYNLTVALRQSWFQSWFSWVFYLPLAFIGFDPLMFITLSAFNTLYQFWIHTRAIKSMGIFEYILNTPAHHRVHHGSNPKYIDKNHGGILIIWDRMFGTFQKEEEEVYYGITTPLASWNPIWANVHYWTTLWINAKKTNRLSDRAKFFIKPPGWYPEDQGGFQNAPEVDVLSYRKFDAQIKNTSVLYYVFFQFLWSLAIASALLFLYPKLELHVTAITAVFVIATLVTCGALLEEKSWVRLYEYTRLTLSFPILFFYLNVPIFTLLVIPFCAVQILTIFWFFYLQIFKLNAQQTPSF